MRKVVAFFRERKRRRGRQRPRIDAAEERKDVLETLRAWFLNATLAFGIIAFGVAILAIVMELVQNSITIESFSVPPSFDEQGYTGRVLALRLIDELSDMNRQAEAGVPRKSFTADWQREAIDLPVPEMNTNLHSIVSVIRHLIGVGEQSFTCEIVNAEGGKLRVRARLTGRVPFAREYAAGTSLDAVITDLAAHFCKQSQPVVYAAYECRRPGDVAAKECEDSIRTILSTSDRIDAMWALNFLGGRQKETDRKRAIDTYTVGIRFGCDNPPKETKTVCAYLLGNRGGLHLDDDPRAAVADLKRAMALRPHDRGILFNLGVAYEHAHDIPRAVETYTAACDAAPKDVRALVSRGTLRLDLHEFDAALDDFNRAISINPTYSTAYLSRARVFQRRQKRDEAEKDFDMAVLLDPRSVAEVAVLRGIEVAQVSPLEMRP